ncbi:MAG: OadG family protein [Magnetococcus sp. WYHC-3]
MPLGELLAQGFELMVLGMLTVFLFLGLLVITVQRMSRVVQWYEARWPTPGVEPDVPPLPSAPGAIAQPDDGAAIAAVTAAVQHHRTR